jgi:prepilin-type N-terminal cleavage/methylation domain-containing protein
MVRTTLNARGMSLVEVMIAAALFSIGVAGTLSSFGMATRMLERDTRSYQALAIADSQLKALALARNDSPLLAMGPPHTETFAADGRRASPGVYSASWTVTADTASLDLRLVRVVVSWTERGASRQLELSTVRP